MKKIVLFLIALLFSIGFNAKAQNGLIGDGFGTNNWDDTNCFGDGAGDSRIFTTTANGNGLRYFRFVTCWDGNFNQWGPASVDNHLQVTLGSIVPSSQVVQNSTTRAYFIDIGGSSDGNFIFKTRMGGNPPGNPSFVVFRVQGDVQTITNLTQSPASGANIITGDSVRIAATMSGTLSAGQGVYLRYTTDNFATSAVLPMAEEGGDYVAYIPKEANVRNQEVIYYAFTSGDNLEIAAGDADLFTINLINNGGANYRYTPTGFYTVFPENPRYDEEITIAFAKTGTAIDPLDEDTASVYAHMGAVLQGPVGTTWDVVKGNWGSGDGIGELTNTFGDRWQITFNPKVYFSTIDLDLNAGSSNPDFEGEEEIVFDSTATSIYRLGLVFRSTNGDLVAKDNGFDTGNDIYIDLDPGFFLLLDPPAIAKEVEVDLADDPTPTTYTISGTTSPGAVISIRVNDNPTPVYTTTGNSFTYDLDVSPSGLGIGYHKVEISATNGVDTRVFTRFVSVFDSENLVVMSSALDPALPTASTEITLTFNATNTTLENADKVYIHSAAVTAGPTSETWGSTIGNWGQDDGVGEMTETAPGSNIWTITLTPENYYFPGGLSSNDNIFRLAMVFRNANGTVQQKGRDGNDIYLDIDPGFFLILNSPAGSTPVVEQNTTFSIQAVSSETADFNVNIDTDPVYNNLINSVTSIDIDRTIATPGTYNITITADNGVTTKTRSIALGVYSAIVSEDPPAGMKYGPNYDKDDPTKATLLLHLPTQGPINVVHVIGDFNNWTVAEEYKMKRSTAGDIWWVELNNLIPKTEYIYQFLVNGTIKAGDPYAEKVSDPDDQFISAERYPGLIAYPFGKTEFRATVLQTDQEEYIWKVNNFERPELYKANMYELLIRDFTEEGTYQAVIDSLDYIKNLGFNTIHLMPTSEFEGNESWGYNPNYYFAPDKFYGPKNKLKELVDEAHKRGIGVVGDLVLNHAFYSSPFARFYWNEGSPGASICAPNQRPRNDNPWMNECHNFIDERAAWWGADFNHNSTHTQALVDSIIDYWMTEYRFDGFRFDFTKGFSNTSITCPDCWGSNYDQGRIDNLFRMKNEMEARHPGAYVIFEHLANPDEDRVLANAGVHMWGGAGITHRYDEIVLGYEDTNRDLTNGVFNAGPFFFGVSNLMSYMESHDEERLAYRISQFGRQFIRDEINAGARDWDDHRADFTGDLSSFIERLRLAASINLLLPGARMVWQFGELGYDYSINYNGRTGNKPVRWDYFENAQRRELHDFYTKVLNLRKDHEVFHHLDGYDLNSPVKWMRFKHNETVVVVLSNFQFWKDGDEQNGGQQAYIDINLNGIFEGCGGNWYELISNQTDNINLGDTYRLFAGDVKIYANVDLADAASGTSAVGDVSWYMSWDDTNVTITTQGMNLADPAVIYFDIDPVFPVSGGTDANGSLVGFNYDNSIINPPFRADFVAFIKNDYRESRTKNNSNGWSDRIERTGTWQYGESICAQSRTITIPWADITGAGKPASFNWFGYLAYENDDTGTYGGQPNFGGYEANYGTGGPFTRNNIRYFTVPDSNDPSTAFELSSYAHDGGTVNFGNFDIHSFVMDRGGAISFNANVTWDVSGTFYVGNGTVNANNATINYSGDDLQLNANFNAETSTFIISGSEPAVINGDNITFHNLVIDNPAGVTLGTNVTITGELTLRSGKVNSTTDNLLIMANGATINETVGAGSFVNGPLRKVGNTAFFFPVGSNTNYAPVALEETAGGATGDFFTVQYFDQTYGTAEDREIEVGDIEPGVFEHVSAKEYWNIDRSGSTNAKVRLYFRDFNSSGITDLSRIVVAHRTGGVWKNEGGVVASQVSRGSVVTTNVVESFSPFTAGGPLDQPLPVELISFTARTDGSQNVLRWETSFEKDNSHFDIYMAREDEEFYQIGTVTGANKTYGAKYNFNHLHQGSGLYYYMLQQVDFDGTSENSPIVVTKVTDPLEENLRWNLFPNPVKDQVFTLRYPGKLAANFPLQLTIVDMAGKVVYAQNVRMESNQQDYSVRLQNSVKTGIYVLKINDGFKEWHTNLIVR